MRDQYDESSTTRQEKHHSKKLMLRLAKMSEEELQFVKIGYLTE